MNQSWWLTKELFCGGSAGAVGVFVGHPFDMVKVRLQTARGEHTTAWKCFNKIIDREGPSGLYRGLTSPLLAQFFLNGLSFGANSICMQFLERERKGNGESSLNILISGCFAGLINCIVLVPTDLVKCKLQIDSIVNGPQSGSSRYRGVADCVHQIVRAEGVKGLYRGLAATCLREVPSFGIYFSVYAQALRLFNSRRTFNQVGVGTDVDVVSLELDSKTSSPSTWSILCAGSLAGAGAWTVVYPMDVIKTHMQIAGHNTVSPSPSSRDGVLQTVQLLYRKYGLRVFTRGLGTAVARAVPVNAVVFLCYETLRDAAGLSGE